MPCPPISALIRCGFLLPRHPRSAKTDLMTNKIALALGLLVIAVFAADSLAGEGGLPVLLGKKLFEFLDWIAFWR
jgi:hypothetical protein